MNKEITLLYLKEELFNVGRKIDIAKQSISDLVCLQSPWNKKEIEESESYVAELQKNYTAILNTINYLKNK